MSNRCTICGKEHESMTACAAAAVIASLRRDLEEAKLPRLARNQPCGCVVCRCEDDERCHGCGSKTCGTHPPGEIPNPVYEPHPLDAQLAAANEAREKAEGEAAAAKELLLIRSSDHAGALRWSKEYRERAEKAEASRDKAKRKLCRARELLESSNIQAGNDNPFLLYSTKTHAGEWLTQLSAALSSSAPCSDAERVKALEELLDRIEHYIPCECGFKEKGVHKTGCHHSIITSLRRRATGGK